MYNEIQIQFSEDLIIKENYDDLNDKIMHEESNYLCYKMFYGEQVFCSARYELMGDLFR